MTELPYSVEVLIAILADFNATWWPVVVAGALATAWLIQRLWIVDRVPLPVTVYLCLAGLAGVAAGPFLLGTMAPLDFMAPVYAMVWLMQVGLMLFAAFKARHEPTVDMPSRRIAISLVGTSVLYSAVFWFETRGAWPSLPLPGAAPDTIAIATIGALCAMRSRLALLGLAVPATWSVIAGFNGYLLGLISPYLIGVALVAGITAQLRLRQIS